MTDQLSLPAQTAPSSTRRDGFLVVILTLVLPIALAVFVFPTPMGDLREQIAWGRQFPLVTPHHPPLMVWLSGIVDFIFGPDIVPQIVAGQLLFAVAAAYVYLTLRLVTERDNVFLFTFLYVTGLYAVLGPGSWVMNADTLQITSWPAVIYHFLLAFRSNRLRHWLALGAWAAAAVLTKYSAAALFAGLAVGILVVPEFRRVFRRPGLYVAVLLGLALVAPHAIAVRNSPAAISHAAARFSITPPSWGTLSSYGQLVLGYFMFLFPAWVIVALGLRNGDLAFRPPSRVGGEWPGALRFVIILNLAVLALLILIIAFAGLTYLYRFDAPFATIAVLALAPLFTWNPDRKENGERRTILAVAAFNVGVVAIAAFMYLALTAHNMMQEPIEGPTEAILSDWRSHYSCGPAYMTGHRRAAQLVGIHAGREVTAIGSEDVAGAPWFDSARLRQRGAVVLDYAPIRDETVLKILPGVTLGGEHVLTLPLLRTFTGQTITYHYKFIAPLGC